MGLHAILALDGTQKPSSGALSRAIGEMDTLGRPGDSRRRLALVRPLGSAADTVRPVVPAALGLALGRRGSALHP